MEHLPNHPQPDIWGVQKQTRNYLMQMEKKIMKKHKYLQPEEIPFI